MSSRYRIFRSKVIPQSLNHTGCYIEASSIINFCQPRFHPSKQRLTKILNRQNFQQIFKISNHVRSVYMKLRKIQVHYEQLLEFERGRIIGLKEAGFGQIGESLVIWVEVMRPLEDAGKNGWTMADFSIMMRRIPLLCPDDDRRRVWRRPGQCANSAFTIVRHTCSQPEVMVWGAFPLVVIKGNLQYSVTSMTF
ncbi:hypothetical protein TNCV_2822601 [Trichonephila clavipes]|nr:hypothetical protein TNCV_2822601 [Trichonephila clavipes]